MTQIEAAKLPRSLPTGQHNLHDSWRKPSSLALVRGSICLLFWSSLILLISEKLFPWLLDVLPWSNYTDKVITCVLLDIWMILKFTLGFTGGVGYEMYWNPYHRAPSLRNKISKDEEAAMARVNREGGQQRPGAMFLIRGPF